ncbi:MAG: nucleoside-diphosphate sugar epimerase/dehydratase [Bacteroidetes bacterium]|nr:nucleoside-diphosphate sugar epimerase/dehydratase [Bacteroidota bacterium]
MIKNELKNAPRWFILGTDLLICLVSISIAFLLRFDFHLNDLEMFYLKQAIPVLLAVRLLSFLIFKSYAGLIRYTGSKDIQRIFTVLLTGSAFLFVLNFVAHLTETEYNIPRTIIIIDFMVSLVIMVLFRMSIKLSYEHIRNLEKEKSSVIIYGAGEFGTITKRALDRDAGTKYTVVAFVDDVKTRTGKTIEGISIIGEKDLEKFIENKDIHHVILADQTLLPAKKKEIVDFALSKNIRVLDVPPSNSWINGELSFKQIKKVKIEDLLERDVIKLDKQKIKEVNTGKIILISGAAGSIGSEIVRQIAQYDPKQIILLDQAESPLYHMETELRTTFTNLSFEVVIGDISNEVRMKLLFETFRPQIVYHAAAYKHVPMMENNPAEAVRVNIKGTRTLADLSVQYGVEKFVMVSTDKAVNPTNVMGASKRIAEIYCQSLNKNATTNFVTTRFGNVLGSNGSVIPIFRKQIEEGGPITVTHPDITRYFMTIPEACQLVLEAGAYGKGGEIFIFDMGESVKIVDLAKKMIKLSRLELGKDIQIQFTGLRPGEKLYEELLNNEENTVKTHHPKIMIANVKEYNFTDIQNHINEVIALYNNNDNNTLVAKMKQIVPEFVSKNSEFEKLDV